MQLAIYNTLSHTKEPFETLEPGKVRMYVCGPTVYDRAHVGHAMSSLVFDIIRRYLEFRGYQVEHVMNYTDVDDKVIRRAEELGGDALDLARGYINEYDQHLRALNILPAKVFPKVSEEISQIVDLVGQLIDKGYAYSVDGDVYFRVSKDDDYGKLSGRQLEDMRAGARIEVDERKEDPADFALWKAAKPGEPSWESPWGKGRPGWHIECSAMSLAHLGEQIDIHGGGNDLVFPHHENEIAQTESLTGKPFARYWVHNGMMQLAGEAMSKSTGNLVTVEAFLEKYPPDALRVMVLNSSYRKPLVYSEEVVDQAERALDRLRGGLRPAHTDTPSPASTDFHLEEASELARESFQSGMDDDFNTAGALGHLFDLVRKINHARDQGADDATLSVAQTTLMELTGVLGLQLETPPPGESDASPFIELLLVIRAELREANTWDLADQIRDRLVDLGVSIEDGKDGTTWRFN